MRGRFATSGRAAFVMVVALGAVLVASAACTAPMPGPNVRERATPKQTKSSAPPEGETTPEVKRSDAGVASETCETVPPTNKCGLDPQCGCLATETCDVTNRANGATSCVTAGSATLGRPCAQTGDCMAGLGCLYGACRPYCKTPLTECDVGGTELCVTMPDEGGKPVPNLSFCTIDCDPREPSGVCGVNACHWFATLYAPHKVSDCNFAGDRGELQTCTDHADCKPGLACIDHPKHGRECERWCRIGVAGDCGTNAAFKCKDVYGDDAPVINGVKEGICQDD
ncbi:MAG: hypothetical protein KF894_01990 [Labilithrix sp.]|nr:hypothetical protein [Labilithrix sp.]